MRDDARLRGPQKTAPSIKLAEFTACLPAMPRDDESINQRFTNLLPSVLQRSWSIESTIFSGLRGRFRSSLSVNGCRRWGEKWGQSNLALPSLTDTMRWITSLPRGVTFVRTIYSRYTEAQDGVPAGTMTRLGSSGIMAAPDSPSDSVPPFCRMFPLSHAKTGTESPWG